MSASSETMRAPEARENGLATYIQVLYAPGEAFAKLARSPMWGWAAIAGVALTLLATIVGMQATLHMIHATQAQQLSQLPAEQAARQRDILAKIPDAVYVATTLVVAVIGPFVIWLIDSVVFLIGAALGGGEARFKYAWVASVNAYMIASLGAVITYSIIALHGAQNINAPSDLYALPSLAMLVHGAPKLEGLLYAYNVVNLWFYIVAVIALERMLKLGRGAAIATVVVASLIAAGLAAAFAK